MAVATSPYVQNDYQAASSYRPYQLPVNDIFKAISAQNQFWDQGAAVVKNAYNNALGLDLTLDKNRALRDEYMKETEKQITKLSSMDLSDPSVQRQGLALFDGLYKNKSIMYDHQITSTLSGIYKTAEDYKRKKLSDKGVIGEGYSDINMRFALKGFENFKKDADLSEKDLEQLYNNTNGKSYTPYYDPTKDFEKALKNCGGAKNQSVTPDSLNHIITKSEGITSSQAKLCIESALSPQAHQQLAINAVVNYEGRREDLVQKVQPFLQREIDHYDALLTDRQAKKMALLNGPHDPETVQAESERYDQDIEKLTELRGKSQEHYNKVSAGNWAQVDQEYDLWATRIYKDEAISSYAEPRATFGIQQDVRGNAGAIAQFTWANRNAETVYKAEQAKELATHQAQLDLVLGAGKGKDGKAGTVPTHMIGQLPGMGDTKDLLLQLGAAEAQEAPTMGYLKDRLKENYNASYGDLKDIVTNMRSLNNSELLEILEKGTFNNQEDYKTVIKAANDYLETRKQTLKPGETLTGSEMALLDSMNNYRDKVAFSQNVKSIIEDVEKQVYGNGEAVAQFSEQVTARMSKELGNPFVLTNGDVVDANRLKNIIEGGDERYSIQRPSGSIPTDNLPITQRVGRGLINVLGPGDNVKIVDKITGEVISDNSKALNRAVIVYNGMGTEFNKKYEGQVEKALGESVAINTLRGMPNAADADELNRSLKSILPNSGSEKVAFRPSSINYNTGEIAFSVYEDEKYKAYNLKELFDTYGTSDFAVGSLRYDDEKNRLYYTDPRYKKQTITEYDEGVNLAKDALARKATRSGELQRQEIFSSPGQASYALEALPMSSGIVYSIKVKKPGETAYKAVAGMERLNADQVNTNINSIRNLYRSGTNNNITVPVQ